MVLARRFCDKPQHARRLCHRWRNEQAGLRGMYDFAVIRPFGTEGPPKLHSV